MNAGARKTVLVGFGKIGAGYANDPVMAKSIPYATHAQVLSAHNAFDWIGVVDNDPEASKQAGEWGVSETVSEIGNFRFREQVEVAVLATPPSSRLSIIEALPNLKAVMVEKPLGIDASDSESLMSVCNERGILVQVNMFRRTERSMIALEEGELAAKVGAIQAAFGLYGNGLSNNGTHLIDLVRQLIGEIKAVQASALPNLGEQVSLPNDVDIGFTLILENDVAVMVQPLRFSHYREVGLDVWGARGRISILNEGCTLLEASRCSSRILSTEREIASDGARAQKTEVGTALYDLYDNLAHALNADESLKSPGKNALKTLKVVNAIRESHHSKCRLIEVSD